MSSGLLSRPRSSSFPEIGDGGRWVLGMGMGMGMGMVGCCVSPIASGRRAREVRVEMESVVGGVSHDVTPHQHAYSRLNGMNLDVD